LATVFSQFGKVNRKTLERVVFNNLGSDNKLLLVKPGHGFDNAVISLGDGRVVILTADPLSIIPSLGMEASAWLSIHLLASDFSTSAVRPQFAMLDLNLPQELSMEDFESYMKHLGNESKSLGISIAGGHTGKYPGCNFTIVGGGVLLGMANDNDYLTPAMAADGDKIMITKGAAIAATGVLSRAFPNKVRKEIGKRSFERAEEYLFKCSTVKDALTASSVGIRDEGVTSMHDATEGGVLGGLYELSSASRKAVVVEKERIFVSKETRKVCSFFGLDPLMTLSEGTLIITCKEDSAEEIQKKLRREGIESFLVGEVKGHIKNGLWIKSGGELSPLVPPSRDPYWDAYSNAMKSGWN